MPPSVRPCSSRFRTSSPTTSRRCRTCRARRSPSREPTWRAPRTPSTRPSSSATARSARADRNHVGQQKRTPAPGGPHRRITRGRARTGTTRAGEMTTTTTELTGGGAAPDAAPVPAAAKGRRSGGGLGTYLLIRFLLIIPTVFILVTTVFFLMRSTGDPITAALGGRLTGEQLAERVHAAGYDRPILTQYWEYLGNVFTGDFGTTISDRRPVLDVLTTF